VCTGHDSTVWHPLVERHADGSIACTYTHHHGDDPSQLDALFDPAGSLWGAPGHAIGYPWLSSPIENIEKHELFKIIVRVDNPKPASGPWIRNFRSWTHSVGSGGHIPGVSSKDGFQTPVHSFALEAEVCRADGVTCGTLQIGGLQDIGVGILDGAGRGGPDRCVMPNTAFNMLSCPEQFAVLQQPRHMHGFPGGNRRDFTWYADTSPSYRRVAGAENFNIGFGTIGQAWAPVDESDVNALPFYDVNVFTGSTMSQEILSWAAPRVGVSGGVANFNGYVDRWGNVRPAGVCQAVSFDCPPLIMVNLPAVAVQYRDSAREALTGVWPAAKHDVHTGDGRSLTRYPN
jgi:hypothetical protein